MKRRIPSFIIFVFFLSSWVINAAPTPTGVKPPPEIKTVINDLEVVLSGIWDRRSTERGEMELRFKLQGQLLKDTQSFKLAITKALDDTQQDLFQEQSVKNYTQPNSQYPSLTEFKVTLKNPARQAKLIQELSGVATLFIPKNDPAAAITIKDVLAQTGKPLLNTVLKAGEIEITVFTKSQYEQYQEMSDQEEDTQDSNPIVDYIRKGMGFAFGGVNIDPNSIVLHLKDPGQKIIDIEFLDETGALIQPSLQGGPGEFQLVDFEQPLPPKAQMVIYLSTPKAVLTFPFTFTKIALP